MIHPVCPPSERITTLDVLSGLVLLGLLITKAFAPLASSQHGHPLPLEAHHPELPVQFMIQLLVSGQFDRMGSFLFGLGFYRCWQQASLESAGQAALDAGRIVRRLLMGLLSVGLILSLLLRSADLLAQYALLGFTLLLIHKQSVSILLRWMVGVSGLVILGPSGLGLLHIARVIPQLQGFSTLLSYELLMLGGLLVGKLGLLPEDPRLRVRLSLLQLVLLPTAFLLKGAWVVLTLSLVALPRSLVAYQPELLLLGGFLGPLLLTGVYVLDVGLNARLSPSGWHGWPARVGQLCLTNYVLQSILCPLLLHGYGVEVSVPLPFLGRVGIVVGIFGVQLGFSRVWVKQYQQGPLEWVCCQWMASKWGQSDATPKR